MNDNVNDIYFIETKTNQSNTIDVLAERIGNFLHYISTKMGQSLAVGELNKQFHNLPLDIRIKFEIFRDESPNVDIKMLTQTVCDETFISGEALLNAIVYILRIHHMYPQLPITVLTINRLFAVCCQVATKFIDDYHCLNSLFASVVDIKLNVFNMLEASIVSVVGSIK